VPAIPVLVLAASVAFLTVAVTLGVASFTSSNLTAGEAGPTLARLLALACLSAGALGTSVALLMFAGAPPADALAPAVVIGVVVGGLEAIFLFIPITGAWIALPAAGVVFAHPALTRGLGGRR
jgi:hypothetical protein